MTSARSSTTSRGPTGSIGTEGAGDREWLVFGDPHRFAIELSWRDLDVGETLSPAEKATWADLRVIAGRTVLTEHLRDGSPRDHIEGSPLGLCRWALAHQNVLFGELEDPLDNDIDDPFRFTEVARDEAETLDEEEDRALLLDRLEQWEAARAWHTLRDRTPLPDVFFWRRGEALLMAWRPSATPRLEFRSDARRILLIREEVEQVFAALTEQVRARLAEHGLDASDDIRIAEMAAHGFAPGHHPAH